MPLALMGKAMRILNLDSLAMVEGFRRLGHDVLSVGFSPGSDIRIDCPRRALRVYADVCAAGFLPDIVFWCDAGNLPYFPGIEELPCPTAYYSIDTYCQLWHFGFANAFDAVFVAQKEHLPLFPHNFVDVSWLPLFARRAEKSIENRDIPIAFVGTRKHQNNPDREPFLQKFRRAQPLFIYSGKFEPIFSRARIVLNQTAQSEVNFRCFEAMACGAALLMEYSEHGLDELFTPGENILPLYKRNDWAGAASIARVALAEPEKLAAIAERGYELVLSRHMTWHRAQTVVTRMERLLAEGAERKRLNSLAERRKFIASSYAMLGNDLSGRLDDIYVDFYLSMAGVGEGRQTAS